MTSRRFDAVTRAPSPSQISSSPSWYTIASAPDPVNARAEIGTRLLNPTSTPVPGEDETRLSVCTPVSVSQATLEASAETL